MSDSVYYYLIDKRIWEGENVICFVPIEYTSSCTPVQGHGDHIILLLVETAAQKHFQISVILIKKYPREFFKPL